MYTDLPLESREVRSLDEWSTPERRLGERTLDPIPIEIYLKIMSEVDDKTDLSNLALVCRFFASVALPRLFERLIINPIYNRASRSWEARGNPKLYRVLHEGLDPLAISACKYIRNCTIDSVFIAKWPPPSSVVSALQDLLKMPNLTTLTLVQLELPKAALSSISQLSSLASLTLRSCFIWRDVAYADMVALADNLDLHSLSLRSSSTWQLADFDPLVKKSQLTNLYTTSWVFVRCLAAPSVVPPLQILELNVVHDLRDVYELLRRIPTLVELKLDSVSWPQSAMTETGGLPIYPPSVSIDFTFPLSTLFSLRRLSCPSYLAYLFTGPHVLEKISLGPQMYPPHRDIWAMQRLSKDLRLFFNGLNVNLRRLECVPDSLTREPMEPQFNGNMQHWFPKLESLDFAMNLQPEKNEDSDDEGEDSDEVLDPADYEDYFEDLLRSFLDTWGPFHSLTELCFRAIDIRNDEEITVRRDWLQDFAPGLNLRDHFPHLSYMSFGNVRYM
ncbi:hypothetical protein GYMLUDRAFT_242527 [Collybiopsis luxurians FD-317 M1]|uniref:F-box domain-containing protein n=1 Tax=Collybiopsis luxurians FD-317 M1 TaxID=944289 RepID=A0A0D0CJD9_9AGAR|nr:hypothetical protein GYMLUDRAFT_242527 [Collybiopsis luxurians FD-317 M1]